MLAYAIGSGVFWLMIWCTMLVMGWKVKNQNAQGVGLIGTIVSVTFLISVIVGYLFL